MCRVSIHTTSKCRLVLYSRISLLVARLLIQSPKLSLVLSHAGAPNVTDLTLDRESRTLTCTSTGGPATTVTWTKDGAVITPSTTHQQTQMIANTTEGIYQNTLTIAQSVTGDNLYGLYSCTVENSRGSSNRTVYFYGKNRAMRASIAAAIHFKFI